MNNGERFQEAFAHVSHKAMGRKLEAFSLRHRFWLATLGSPLESGGAVSLIDLELASRICAIPSQRLDRDVPRLLARGPRWYEKLGFLWKIFRCNAELEYMRFREYFIDYGCPPSTHQRETVNVGGKRYEQMPGILDLVTGLVRCSGWDPNTVWSLPPGAAEWYLVGIFRHRGVDTGLKTEQDEEFEAGMRREREEKAAGAGDMAG